MAEKESNKKITITKKAKEKIDEILKDHKDSGLRIMIGVGCCGFGYQMGVEKKEHDDDKIIEVNKIKMYLDPSSYAYLNNMKVDYVESEEQEGFKIDNGDPRDSPGCPSGCSC